MGLDVPGWWACLVMGAFSVCVPGWKCGGGIRKVESGVISAIRSLWLNRRVRFCAQININPDGV